MAKGKLKCELILIGIGLLTAIIWGSSCDERNITEPRFYTEANIHDLTYEWADSTHTVLYLQFSLRLTSRPYPRIVGSAGQEIKDFANIYDAGMITIEWDLTDNNGQRVPDGVYGFAVTYYDQREMLWFELK